MPGQMPPLEDLDVAKKQILANAKQISADKKKSLESAFTGTKLGTRVVRLLATLASKGKLELDELEKILTGEEIFSLPRTPKTREQRNRSIRRSGGIIN